MRLGFVNKLPRSRAAALPWRPGHPPFPPLLNWRVVISRLPLPARFSPLAPRAALRPLDRGFFFPATTPWVPGARPFKALRLASRGYQARPKPLADKYKRALWEVLEGLAAPGGPLFHKLKRRPPRPAPAAGPDAYGLPYGASHGAYAGLRRTRWNPSSVAAAAKKSRVSALVPSYRWRRRGTAATPTATPFSPLMAPPNWSRPPRPLTNGAGASEAHSYNLKAAAAELLAEPTAPAAGFHRRRGPGGRPKKPGKAIPQVRYKPDLARAWRLLRLQYCLAWGLPWLRQRRFTNYIAQVTNVTGLNLFHMCLCSVGGIARASGLAPQMTGLGDLVFLNGKKVTNPFVQAYKGDRVTVTKGVVCTTSRAHGLLKTFSLTPLYGLEADGLSRCATLLSYPSLKELRAVSFSRPFPFLTMRMYNWKYRH